MKKILLQFKTAKGVKAYQQVEKAGKKETWKNKKIAKKVCTDHIISHNPLIVEIEVKIGWLAVQVDLPTQIIQGLAKFDAEEGKDYTMDVS